jgi:hypothetical protein
VKTDEKENDEEESKGSMEKGIDGIERHVEFVRSFKEIWGDIFKWMEDPENGGKTLEELNQSHMAKVMKKA